MFKTTLTVSVAQAFSCTYVWFAGCPPKRSYICALGFERLIYNFVVDSHLVIWTIFELHRRQCMVLTSLLGLFRRHHNWADLADTAATWAPPHAAMVAEPTFGSMACHLLLPEDAATATETARPQPQQAHMSQLVQPLPTTGMTTLMRLGHT